MHAGGAKRKMNAGGNKKHRRQQADPRNFFVVDAPKSDCNENDHADEAADNPGPGQNECRNVNGPEHDQVGFAAPSGENVGHHIAVHVRQTEVASLVTIRQFLVIESQQVEDGRVQIMNVNRLFSDI